jgi:hypothetical protein
MNDRISINNLTSEQLDKLYDQLAEARMWARHGYEIGQRACTWSDHGVAPAWLTEGWPTHFPSDLVPAEPAYNGPTVAEATFNDRRWPLEREGE